MQPQLNRQEVTVTDVKMPFSSMVVFMVKWAFASIPALIIVSIVLGILLFFSATMINGLMHSIQKGREIQQRQIR